GQDRDKNKEKDSINGRAFAVIGELDTIAFVKKLTEACRIKMYNPHFYKKENMNKNIICCENGVLDLLTYTFREGRPDDYCTFSTKRYYREYNDGDDDVLEFDLYMKKTLTNENRRNYFLDSATLCLQGGNRNKKAILCVGETNGGKSGAFRVLEACFGDYMTKF